MLNQKIQTVFTVTQKSNIINYV